MRKLVPLLAIAAAAALAGCGSSDDDGSTTGGGSSGDAGSVAFLLPDTVLTRWEQQDRPAFVEAARRACPDCKVMTYNAQGDAAKQQSQAEAAITNGAKVLVITAVDTDAAAGIVAKAHQQDVKVISYGRIIQNADVDYGITLDPVEVGEMQARDLVETLERDGKGDGSIIMVNGSPTDQAAPLYKRGAHNVIDASDLRVVKEYDTPNWDPQRAQAQVEQAITAVGKDGFDAIYAANDGTGGGSIAAMKGAGIDPSTKPVTGQDAELAAIQRILAGEQLNTIYQPIPVFGARAAEIAVALAQGREPPAGIINGEVDNGQKQVPTYLYEPVLVKRDNVADTVVRDGFLTVEQICTAPYRAACRDAGLL
ncbi:sugar ABC transporter substrate-binding protein [Conexibacter arvalis]|uniref:D-xylose transport system substrate-binding protein n=1 Tax=Conexibacter arvalis TaxID=912552 RepID=A0A840I960_9ACTN|nr:sugar ABC transporter substrate-binding protein [Conexibacter arvalis]MBB4660855.1 D-xylose transport system substrate-binding protein [Conexibacter arvalis]